MRSSRSTLAAIVAAAGLGAMAASTAVEPSSSQQDQARTSKSATSDPVKQTQRAGTNAAERMRDLLFGRYSPSRPSYPNGPGWSNRHVQCMARKRKNQARNKAAHRRAR